jgi:hypothetical protein
MASRRLRFFPTLTALDYNLSSTIKLHLSAYAHLSAGFGPALRFVYPPCLLKETANTEFQFPTKEFVTIRTVLLGTRIVFLMAETLSGDCSLDCGRAQHQLATKL